MLQPSLLLQTLAISMLALPSVGAQKRITCQVCTNCEAGDIGEGVCPDGQICFTLRRASKKVTDRGCGKTCSPAERGSIRGDHCHMCDFDRCNAIRKSVTNYAEPELMPLPPPSDGQPIIFYDRERIKAMNGSLLNEDSIGGGARPDDAFPLPDDGGIGGGAIPSFDDARKELEEEERRQAELDEKVRNEEAEKVAKEEERLRLEEEAQKREKEEAERKAKEEEDERLRKELEELEAAEAKKKAAQEAEEEEHKWQEDEKLQAYLDIIEGVFERDLQNEIERRKKTSTPVPKPSPPKKKPSGSSSRVLWPAIITTFIFSLGRLV